MKGAEPPTPDTAIIRTISVKVLPQEVRLDLLIFYERVGFALVSIFCRKLYSSPGLAMRRARRISLRPFESVAHALWHVLHLAKEKSPPYDEHFSLAERVGFEPTRACALLVFKTSAIDHSAISPNCGNTSGTVVANHLFGSGPRDLASSLSWANSRSSFIGGSGSGSGAC